MNRYCWIVWMATCLLSFVTHSAEAAIARKWGKITPFESIKLLKAAPPPFRAQDMRSYTVSAFDAARNPSAQSSPVSATTQAVGSINGSYSTNFPLNEDPISEGGVWINGGTTGLDWGNVQTSSGHVFGVSMPSQYGDPTAVLTGTWSPDQQAQATVRVISASSITAHEVELRLRTTITAHSITGYEIECSTVPNDPYMDLVRWNGALNDFSYLQRLHTGSPLCRDGDILSANAVGNVITVYLNGVQVMQATDPNAFPSGSPGVGFYDNADSNWSNFGFSNFSASNY